MTQFAAPIEQRFRAAFDGLRQRLAKLEQWRNLMPTAVQDTWHTPTLQNSWTQRTGNMACEYTKMPFGSKVWLKGVIVPGTKTDGTLLFTMQPGYYNTSENWQIPCATTGISVAIDNVPFIQINSADGTVTCNGVNLAGLTNLFFNGFISLTSP